MSQFLKLDMLTENDTGFEPVFRTRAKLEAQKAEAFAAGLKLGETQAMRKFEAQGAQISADLSRTIQQISFTHFEARKAVLDGLEQLIHRFLDIIMPEITKAEMAGLILSHIVPLAREKTSGQMKLTCAPAQSAALARQIARLENPALDITVVQDTAFSPGQATLESGSQNLHFDLDQALEEIRLAVQGFYILSSEEKMNDR